MPAGTGHRRSAFIRLANRANRRSFLTSHSQTVKTDQPILRSAATLRLSRTRLPSTFADQYAMFDFTRLVPSTQRGHPCQKQPCTSTNTLRPGKTRSGFPGSLAPCRRNRSPLRCSPGHHVAPSCQANIWAPGRRKLHMGPALVPPQPARRNRACDRGAELIRRAALFEKGTVDPLDVDTAILRRLAISLFSNSKRRSPHAVSTMLKFRGSIPAGSI